MSTLSGAQKRKRLKAAGKRENIFMTKVPKLSYFFTRDVEDENTSGN